MPTWKATFGAQHIEHPLALSLDDPAFTTRRLSAPKAVRVARQEETA